MLRRRAARRQVERAREQMPEGRIGGRYLMREKIFAVGDDFYVQNEQGQNVYKIDGKAFRIRATLLFEDLQGNEIELEAEGVLARAIQHEVDHLDGVLFITRFSPVQRLRAASRLKELERQFRGEA